MHFLITAGPTREAIDPVRYISNHSSGKMGYAIARAALEAGHQVTLITGPTAIDPPDTARLIAVTTAAEMYDAVAEHITSCDVAVMVAAVSDFRPVETARQKIKKSATDKSERLTLELEKNPDILGSTRGAMGFGGILVGFAAETEHLEQHAQDKLRRKGCDLVAANDVSNEEIGFDSDDNALILLYADATRENLARAPKAVLASELVKRISRLAIRRTATDSPATDTRTARS